jgi:hypothetical protein
MNEPLILRTSNAQVVLVLAPVWVVDRVRLTLPVAVVVTHTVRLTFWDL